MTRAVPAVAFRVPAGGGPLAVYSLPGLSAPPGGAGSRLSGARSAVGMDIVGRRLLFRDSSGGVASFDLVALRQRALAPRRALATMAADGSLLAVDSSGGITESEATFTRQWSDSLGKGLRQVFAAPGSRLIAVRHGRGEDTLQVVERGSGVTLTQAIPQSTDRVASRDGDAIAMVTDSGVLVYEDRDMEHPWFVHLAGKPRSVVFSPSGHRLYTALEEKSELAVVDRFSHKERAAVKLPSPAGKMRPDPWGRVILVRPDVEASDAETWVVSTASNMVEGTIPGGWASDLPAVSENGVLLDREKTAVVARDVHTLDSLGAVPGGARDLWFAGRWVPSSAAAGARSDIALAPVTMAPAPVHDSGKAVQPPAGRPVLPTAAAPASAPAPGPPQPVGPPPAFYIQLIATRSEDAARSLAAEIPGPHVQVFAPRPGTGDDNWRVMVGPFRSRDVADSAGRDLGRAYWIVDRTREQQQ